MTQKRFKFELGGAYTFFHGKNLGRAIEAFIDLWGYPRLREIESITEQPYTEGELP